ncbi:MAG: GNAT family N-acetyltransferase [Ardenticatenales bacterium]|nr:GNAT family N-acetyltransferase [Ardenticatenales bacterium]
MPEDSAALLALDTIAPHEGQRVAFIRRIVSDGSGYVALAEEEVAGYGVLEYNFFDNGFISMLYVGAVHRRQGVGQALMEHMAKQCRSAKLFTSTNLSNLPMQTLLARLGYVLSGVIHNLDEGDPEVVYFKGKV